MAPAEALQPAVSATTVATRAMIATPHSLASEAGLGILKRGGSAIDACIAANAVLCVVYPHQAGLGGDLFAQIWDPAKRELVGLNGSGRAGGSATIEAYERAGHRSVPERGPLSVNTVPGAVDAWAQLHDRYGRCDWTELFQPAIALAQDGFALSASVSRYAAEQFDLLKANAAAASVFLPAGTPPSSGELLRQPELAGSLRLLARQGPAAFYQGQLAAQIVASLQSAGGLLTLDDFAAHRSDWMEPLRTEYRGREVCELPPNTQGLAVLILLDILEGLDLPAMGEGTADYYHALVEATKLAYADRDRWVTDPDTLDVPLQRLLSKSYARERRELLDMSRALEPGKLRPGVQGRGDTVYLCAVDENGMAVSLIESIYHDWGSGFMAEGTGIFMHDRGCYFSLDPAHPNALAPRKRTFHTLIPAMVLQDGRPVLAFGCMGGSGQPQTHAALLTRLLDYGLGVQEAISAPRFRWAHDPLQGDSALALEGRIPATVVHELRRRGHAVDVVEPWSNLVGTAQAIWIDRQNGLLRGGADPRGDGLALGY
jgi:gamma-glutamyltranspeptidase